MKLIETIKPPEARDTLVNNVQNDDVVVQEFETFLNFFFSRVYFFTVINMSFDYYITNVHALMENLSSFEERKIYKDRHSRYLND